MKRLHSASNAHPVVPTLYIKDGQVAHVKEDADSGRRVIATTAHDGLELARNWSVAGEILVLPLDRPRIIEGTTQALLSNILNEHAKVRVGVGALVDDEGIEEALCLMDGGVTRIIVDFFHSKTDLLVPLPAERVTAHFAVDIHGNVVPVDVVAAENEENNHGAKSAEIAATTAHISLEEWILSASKHAKSLFVTLKATQGSATTVSIDRSMIQRIAKAAGDAGIEQIMIGGGISTPEDVQFLDALGIESSISTSILTGRLHLGDALSAVLVTDRADSLITSVVVDETLACLGVCYSNTESIREAVAQRRGIYWSRSRGRLWTKGETSGDVQELLRIDMDCDRDALRFVVRQSGGFCHVARRSCFGDDSETIGALMRVLLSRRATAPVGSYTRRLFDDPKLLSSKLHEEADELLEANEPNDVAWETADVIYFALTACARHGVPIDQVQSALERRTLRVRRRPGNAKPPKDTPPPPAAAGGGGAAASH